MSADVWTTAACIISIDTVSILDVFDYLIELWSIKQNDVVFFVYCAFMQQNNNKQRDNKYQIWQLAFLLNIVFFIYYKYNHVLDVKIKIHKSVKK